MNPGPRRRPPLVALAGIVALGGAVGTTARALLEHVFAPVPGSWPWTTFAINVVGSFVLGVLLETLVRSGPDEGRRRTVRLGCGTGVLGGFTTYSTFAVEAERLLTGGHAALGVAYALVSVVVGIVAACAGIVLAGAWARRRRAGRAGQEAGA
ncbi:CrcB family protein [Cellulosimicrobium terreum]|nr:CrcB family protein [Cellulosimicrobium terreum]